MAYLASKTILIAAIARELLRAPYIWLHDGPVLASSSSMSAIRMVGFCDIAE